ncbi:MAG: hypothetical protein IJL30_00830 [Clostridia bacterium]|nr:hypothetical protein [Clostridia bacterium]
MNDSADFIFEAHIRDLVLKANKTGKTVFSDFLSDNSAFAAVNTLKNLKCKYLLYGGYDDAEYRMLAVFFDNEPENSDFPIQCLRVASNNKNASMTHRDYMGALMSLGIERDSFGDIIAFPTEAYVFVNKSISDYIASSLVSVGRNTCHVSYASGDFLSMIKRQFDEKSIIITSDRIDCFVSSVCNFSREKSSKTIQDKLVFINGKEVSNSSFKIKENDIIVICGFGKYIVGQFEGKTHKNRLKLKVKKYN